MCLLDIPHHIHTAIPRKQKVRKSQAVLSTAVMTDKDEERSRLFCNY